jgi:hypothetical protein
LLTKTNYMKDANKLIVALLVTAGIMVLLLLGDVDNVLINTTWFQLFGVVLMIEFAICLHFINKNLNH